MGRTARIRSNKRGDLPSQLNAVVPEQLLLNFNRACVESKQPRDVVVEAAIRFYLERKPAKRAAVRSLSPEPVTVPQAIDQVDYDDCVTALALTRRLAEQLLEATKTVEPLLRVAGRKP